mgnify:FL=1
MKYEEKAMKYKLNIDYDNAEYFYHCNVSGDFMLLHRDKWFELHGNPENTYVAVHTDALMVIIAGTYGLKEKVFNAPIYHQDHDRRFDCDDIDVDPMLYDAYHTFQSKAQGMLKNNKAVIYNGDNWGMPEKDFQEVVF